MNYIDNLNKRLKFFKKGDSSVLERYRGKTFGWLDYSENIIVPQITKFLKLGLYRDKKTLRICSDAGLVEYEIFNLLLGKVFYDGKMWGIELEDIEIIEGELLIAELFNIQFNGTYKPVILSQNVFNDVLFNNCKFTYVDFTNSVFKNCKFISCYFKDCDFQNCLFGATLEEKVNNATMRYRINVVKDCIATNCTFSTASGVGPAPFFTKEINEGLIETNLKLWDGEKMYNLNEDTDILSEIKETED